MIQKKLAVSTTERNKNNKYDIPPALLYRLYWIVHLLLRYRETYSCDVKTAERHIYKPHISALKKNFNIQGLRHW